MFDSDDLKRVFDASHRIGFPQLEIYEETCEKTHVQLRGRVEQTTFSTTGGVALRARNADTSHHFSTPAKDIESWISILEGNPVTEMPPPQLAPREFSADAVSTLSNTARTAFQSEMVRSAQLEFVVEVKKFEVVSSEGIRGQGVEETAYLGARWITEKAGRPVPHQAQLHLGSAAALLATLKVGNPILEEVKRSLAKAAQWPAPRGTMPVYWASKAVAKLCLPFLRAFEGDLVLGDASFLTRVKLPLPFSFEVEERPRLPFDHEGSPTKTMRLLEGGRPRALAVNRKLAEQLSVTSTGHCRRNLHGSSTVALWSPRVIGSTSVVDLEGKVDWGIHVEDLEISRFDAATGNLRLKLTRARLIHHGKAGELTESVEWDTNLIALLSSLKWFSEASETLGFRVNKNQQSLLTEVCAPSAVSESLFVPGQAPLQNYW